MKPIPPNRRWNGGLNSTAQPPANSNRDSLEGVLICEFSQPQTLDDELREIVESLMIVPTILARYRTTCRACFQPIQVGDPIVRHAQAGCWVHQACYNRPLRSTARSLIVAQYDGYCRLCHGGIQPGELITRVQGRGWVHAHCAEE